MKRVAKNVGVFLIGYLIVVSFGYLAFGVSPLDFIPKANGEEVVNQTEKPEKAILKKIVPKPRPMRTMAVVSKHVLYLENVTEKGGEITTAIHMIDGSRITTHKSVEVLTGLFEEKVFVILIGRSGY